MNSPAAIIIAPPWPRSSTARAIQNQIMYDRDRGYLTIFIDVAIRWYNMRTNPIWDDLREGINDLGADHVFIRIRSEKLQGCKIQGFGLACVARHSIALWPPAGRPSCLTA